MKIQSLIFMIAYCFTFQTALGQNDTPAPLRSDVQALSQQGNLVAVKVVPGQPIKIFVVGKEEASIDLSNLNWGARFNGTGISLDVQKIDPSSKRKILTVKRLENHFIISEPLPQDPVELEMTVKVKGKSEKFRFKVKQVLP